MHVGHTALPQSKKIKLAFFVGIADALRDQNADIRTVTAPDSDVSESDIHDNCALEILTPLGFAFRFRIYHDQEKALLDGIVSDSKAAPGAVVAAKDALRVHEMLFTHATRHHPAVAALTHQLPSYAPTVRLTIRWLGARLLWPHIAHALVEHIVVREFLKPGTPPASAPTAFTRVMQTLKEWGWREEAFVIPLFFLRDESGQGGEDGEKLAKKAEEACRALRRENPTMSRGAWVVVTQEDTGGLRWGGSAGPRAVVAARVQQIAKASLECVLGQDVVEKVRWAIIIVSCN
jgi:U3 small nucleolar RNA-associated protein 22